MTFRLRISHKERHVIPILVCVYSSLVWCSFLHFVFADAVILSCLNLIFFTLCRRCLFLVAERMSLMWTILHRSVWFFVAFHEICSFSLLFRSKKSTDYFVFWPFMRVNIFKSSHIFLQFIFHHRLIENRLTPFESVKFVKLKSMYTSTAQIEGRKCCTVEKKK